MTEEMIDKEYEKSLDDSCQKALEKEVDAFVPTQEPRSPKISGDVHLDRVRDTLVNLHNTPLSLILPDNTLEQMGLDSLEAFDLAVELEEEFSIEIDMDINEKTKFSELVEYMKEHASDD